MSLKVGDGRPAGFDGSIAITIKGAGGVTCWQARCSQLTPTHVIVQSDRASSDVMVGLDEQSAAWMLGAAQSPGALRVVTGDRALWDAFCDRYLGTPTTLIGLRAKRPP